jgi:hypothetical protein
MPKPNNLNGLGSSLPVPYQSILPAAIEYNLADHLGVLDLAGSGIGAEAYIVAAPHTSIF